MQSEQQMRERFHELSARREEILAKSTPLRERRDALVREYEPRVRELNRQIKLEEAGLFDIDQERAMLVRALKGKTGEPPPKG